QLDGASKWQQFWRITLPMLSPTMFFVIVMKMIGVFNIFEQPFIMTNGGPSGSTETIVYYIYSNAFEWFNMGYASAVAWVLFIIVFVLTLIQFKYQGKWVHYE